MYAEINTIYNWGNFDTYAEVNKWNVAILNTEAQLLLPRVEEELRDVYDKKKTVKVMCCVMTSKTALGPTEQLSFDYFSLSS